MNIASVYDGSIILLSQEAHEKQREEKGRSTSQDNSQLSWTRGGLLNVFRLSRVKMEMDRSQQQLELTGSDGTVLGVRRFIIVFWKLLHCICCLFIVYTVKYLYMRTTLKI